MHCPHCHSLTAQTNPAAPYCCSGCRLAHQFLTDAGLSRYYDLRQGPGVPALSPDEQDAAARSAYLEPLLEEARGLARGQVLHLQLDVQGIQCAACVYLLEQLFRRHPGALRIEVNPGVGRLALWVRDGEFSVPDYVAEIATLGYRTGPPRKGADSPLDRLVLRFGLAMAIAMNSMIFSFSLYFGLSGENDATLFRLFSWLNFGLTGLSVVLCGSVFFQGALQALRRGVLHLDVPISLGILSAFGGSTWSFFTGAGRASYFDTINTFIALMLLGRLLQRRVVSQNRALLLQDEGVEGLLLRSLDEDGRVRVAPASKLKEGATLLVLPGELVPTRARLLEEEPAAFSLESINGEPEPRRFTAAQVIPAGSHNATRKALRLKALEDFSASSLRSLLSAPRPSDDSSLGEGVAGGASDFWHRLARRYVVLVLLAAAAALWLWWPQGPAQALDIATAVLVVTCPCAIGLASPLCYELAQAALRRRGLFVRRGAFLDRLLRVRKVIFDKTGTLTLGELTLVDAGALEALDARHREILYQLVVRSSHPKSRALLSALRGGDAPAFDATLDVREEPGQGVEVDMGEHRYRLGSARFAAAASGDDDEVLFSRDGAVLARFRFREELRPGAREQIAALREAGLAVYLLSGDVPERVRLLAERLGLDPEVAAQGGRSPQQKEDWVRALDQHDTLMIGDGLNDTLAFEAAYTAGTPAVERPSLPSRADFFFLGRSLGPITEALRLARLTRRVITRNLVLATGYNVLTVTLALMGKMSPLLCALAMPLSSIVIVLSTVRAYRNKEVVHERHLSHPVREPDPGGGRGAALHLQLQAPRPRSQRSAVPAAAP